jgi:hypothetical protein
MFNKIVPLTNFFLQTNFVTNMVYKTFFAKHTTFCIFFGRQNGLVTGLASARHPSAKNAEIRDRRACVRGEFCWGGNGPCEQCRIHELPRRTCVRDADALHVDDLANAARASSAQAKLNCS